MFNRGGIGSVRHFHCKFLHKMRPATCPCAFRPRRLAQNTGRGIRAWHCPCKFLHKMPLVICPCAFRLRRLAPKHLSRDWRSALILQISIQNGSCAMSMCISISQARTKCASCLLGSVFLLNILLLNIGIFLPLLNIHIIIFLSSSL